MNYDEQAHFAEMEALYGPEYKYSEYKRGDRITYRSIDTGQLKTDTIGWVAAGGTLSSGKTVPARYIVGFDVVYLGEVVEGSAGGPSLVRCPHCGAMHQAGTVDQCPQKRR